MTIEPSMLTLLNRTDSEGLAYDTDPDRNPGWYQFVSDHKEYIRNNSTYNTLSLNALNQVKYDLKRFLREQNFSLKYTWIIELINTHFDEKTFAPGQVEYIYIPDVEFLNNLFIQYKNVQKETQR